MGQDVGNLTFGDIVLQYTTSSMLVHQGIGDSLEHFGKDRGCAAYTMTSNHLDWPTVHAEAENSFIQSVIIVQNRIVFHELNNNKTVIHVRDFLSHYFDHIPSSAEL